jgi:diacylglycerol kinase family enzyme
MASIGPDASVVHRLDRRRNGPISHRSYIRPILAEAIRPVLPRLTVHADGVEVIRDEPGLLVVANSRHYALRADPAPRANCSDGLLDLVFFPASSATRVAFWLVRARLRLTRGCTQARARVVTISTSDQRARLQVDGEAGYLDAGGREIKLAIAAAPASINALVNAATARSTAPLVHVATPIAERTS